VTCTFTNVKKGHVVVTKVTDPVDNVTTFSLHAQGTGTITAPANRSIQSGTPQDFEVTPGTYRVGELAQAGWDITGNTCQGLVVAAGATVPCTITNTKKGSIKIVKNTSGGDTTFNFSVAGPNSYTASPSILTSGGTGETTLSDVSAGSGYSVSETALAGWDLTASSCDNGTPASFSVPAGATVTCTFTNVKKGHVVVTKVTDPVDNVTTFSLHAEGTGSITAPANRSIQSGTPQDFEVTPGTYRVGELAQAGWDITGNTCQGLVVAAGATVPCTITNTKKGHVVVTKVTNPANDPTSFSIHAEGTGSITAPANRSIQSGTPQDFEVTPGTYRVGELAQAGWDITGNTCQGLAVAAGATVPCTITNTKKGHVVVTKVTEPTSDPTTFSITASGSGTITPPAATTITAAAPVSFEVTPGTYAVAETPLAGWVMSNNTCTGLVVVAGGSQGCTITNKKDTDNDGIPDSIDCDPLFKDNVIVDPGNVVPATFTGIRVATLQAAVIAASDNDVISMYANTTENVIISTSNGSGGKDLRIVGCGHKITSAAPQNANLPVITVEVSAGKNDGDTGQGEADIHIEDLSVLKGSTGFLIQTSKASSNNTSTLLKSIRSDQNGPSNGTGAGTAANPGNGVNIVGDGNEVRGANSIGTNSGDGIQVTGNSNMLKTNRITSNKVDGIDVTGKSNTINANKVGEKGVGNKGNGILVTCPAATTNCANTINENDVFGNSLLGIKVTGNMNLVFKNDVGEDTKGNLGGGILITGDSNLLGQALNENSVFENGGIGISVVGNKNMISKNDVGDTGKGNTGGGIKVAGSGNMVDQNNVFANTGDGISTTGSTAANPNQITNNAVGDRGKGNTGDGLMAGVAADVGNIIHDNTIYANSKLGMNLAGSSGQIYANSVGDTSKGNLTGGITCASCNSNVFGTVTSPNNIFANTGNGLKITGDSNMIVNNNVGDSGKGNTGDGIDVVGKGNTIDQNDVFANGKSTFTGDGINVSGGTAALPNVISNNTVGSGGKGNFGNGIVVANAGNGITNPVEIIGNTTRANGLNGVNVTGTAQQLQNNVSGGSGAYPGGQDNRKCEFLVPSNTNFNTGGNTANGALIAGAVNSAFPTACQGTP
jgi:hypothetical protein